jgi:hypothetical protein
MSLASDIMAQAIQRLHNRASGKSPEVFGGTFASALYKTTDPDKMHVGVQETSQVGNSVVQYFQFGYSPMDGTHKLR